MIKNSSKFNLILTYIHNTHLHGLTVGVGVIRELLKEDEKLSTVLLVKIDGDIDSVSI